MCFTKECFLLQGGRTNRNQEPEIWVFIPGTEFVCKSLNTKRVHDILILFHEIINFCLTIPLVICGNQYLNPYKWKVDNSFLCGLNKICWFKQNLDFDHWLLREGFNKKNIKSYGIFHTGGPPISITFFGKKSVFFHEN